MIPLTELRHLYRLLRKTLVSTAVHRRIAEEFLRCPDNLQKLVERSRAHFGLYDNRDEVFCPGAHDLSPEVCASPDPVHQVLVHIAQNGVSVPLHSELDAGYVDYEVSPIRTTRSEFENAIPASNNRGIDILLSNARDKLPVLVEQKGAKDRNLFFALIQALMYAVEFSTPAQRERLTLAYPGRFAWSPNGPVLDIYLLLVGKPQSSDHQTFLSLVNHISERLMDPGTPVADMVRRIVCLETSEESKEERVYTIIFQHPLPPDINPPNG